MSSVAVRILEAPSPEIGERAAVPAQPIPVGSRRERGARRRAEIVRVAIRAFRTRGYHAVSMTEIATAVGVTKPALYLHFASKDALFAAVIAEVGRALRERVLAAGTPEGTAVEEPTAVVTRLYGVLTGPPSSLEVLELARWVTKDAAAVASEALADLHAALAETLAANAVADAAHAGPVADVLIATAMFESTRPRTEADSAAPTEETAQAQATGTAPGPMPMDSATGTEHSRSDGAATTETPAPAATSPEMLDVLAWIGRVGGPARD